MRNFTQRFLFPVCLLLLMAQVVTAQKEKVQPKQRCKTMEELEKTIRENPGILDQWKAEGERRYNEYLLQHQGERPLGLEGNVVVVPIVFHLVDAAATLNSISDRDIYEEVEILNRDYNGKKADLYRNVIPAEMTNRVGRVSVKFVLARRAPDGSATTGIERRVNASPDHVSIKATATGGLDAWDPNNYVNVWAGTFSGADAGLLGIATFPFTTGQGAQGVVIGINTLPFTTATAGRSYYPDYAEGATLSHEIGHYFYLWHTFGDLTTCNNQDFRLQAGWDLPTGAGPEGDDTPDEQAGPGNAYFGNPSMNFMGLCTTVPYGIAYGSFMNYFDDRALFMFTDGMRKRIEGCIDLYRPGLKTSNRATPLAGTTDAFLVTVNPRGLPERINHLLNNSPFKAVVRNNGSTNLNSVSVSVKMDAGAPVTTTFPVTLAPGTDTTLPLANITGATGGHTLTVYTSSPNGGADAFLNNDTLQSFIYIHGGTITAPFTESFTSATFPPANWVVWNPNGGATSTWTRSGTSGFTAAGAALFNNFSISQIGTMDELVTPAIDLTTFDSSALTFRVAHAVYDAVDVSQWDGLEIYVSGDGGLTYNLVYKKTGNQLKTIDAAQTTAFSATPAQPDRWRLESVNLSPYIIPGKKMIIKFRNTDAYGNNLLLDDISVSATHLLSRDAAPLSFLNLPPFTCSASSLSNVGVTITSNGVDPLTSLKVNYRVDNGTVASVNYPGTLNKGQTANITLGTINNLQGGTHTLTVFTSDPNGLADQNTKNDTISVNFLVFSPVAGPVREGFEGNSFPPANWGLIKSNKTYTWERTTRGADSGIASAWIRNHVLNASGARDELFTPILQLNAPDSVLMTFDVAHVTARYPGSTAVNLDTLEVLFTKDCGQTFTSVYKKWGTDLQSIGDPNFPIVYPLSDTVGFVPNSPAQWRSEKIDASAFLAGSNANVQFVFRNTNNNGNNIFLDNINLSAIILPARLKNQGYIITPNPTNGLINIRHYPNPTSLKAIQIINANGQVVIEQLYNGNAISNIPIDLSRFASGIYTVRMIYTNKVVTQRIIKAR